MILYTSHTLLVFPMEGLNGHVIADFLGMSVRQVEQEMGPDCSLCHMRDVHPVSQLNPIKPEKFCLLVADASAESIRVFDANGHIHSESRDFPIPHGKALFARKIQN